MGTIGSIIVIGGLLVIVVLVLIAVQGRPKGSPGPLPRGASDPSDVALMSSGDLTEEQRRARSRSEAEGEEGSRPGDGSPGADGGGDID